jgi:predicted Rdx family selenoprotein
MYLCAKKDRNKITYQTFGWTKENLWYCCLVLPTVNRDQFSDLAARPRRARDRGRRRGKINRFQIESGQPAASFPRTRQLTRRAAERVKPNRQVGPSAFRPHSQRHYGPLLLTHICKPDQLHLTSPSSARLVVNLAARLCQRQPHASTQKSPATASRAHPVQAGLEQEGDAR